MCSAPFSVDHELFQWFKQRANVSSLGAWEVIDENIRDLVSLMHEFQEVAPVYSCEGHGPFVSEDGEECSDNYRFYLLVVTWGYGTYLIDEIMRRVNHRLPVENPLVVTVNQMCNISDVASSGPVYTGLCLERYSAPEDKLEFLTHLTDVVRTMVEQQQQ